MIFLLWLFVMIGICLFMYGLNMERDDRRRLYFIAEGIAITVVAYWDILQLV